MSYTTAEINEMHQVATLGNLSDYDLANLYLLAVQMLGSEHPNCTIWLRDEVDNERRIRAAGGLLERGLPSIPYRWSIPDIVHMGTVFHYLRDYKTLSETAREWCRSVHARCWVTVAAKAKSASVNDKLLTVRETCDALGVSRDQLWQLVKAGKIKEPLKLGPRTYRFHPSDVLGCLGNGI
jgi:excisionase family DNA binding protein